jgi:hypothetical protein
MMLHIMLALLVGLFAGALLARRAAERRARAAWSAAALASLTDVSAHDLKRIIGHLPPWVRDAEFQKVRAAPETRARVAICCVMRLLTLASIARRWRG